MKTILRSKNVKPRFRSQGLNTQRRCQVDLGFIPGKEDVLAVLLIEPWMKGLKAKAALTKWSSHRVLYNLRNHPPNTSLGAISMMDVEV